jgi:hypothetical protein
MCFATLSVRDIRTLGEKVPKEESKEGEKLTISWIVYIYNSVIVKSRKDIEITSSLISSRFVHSSVGPDN